MDTEQQDAHMILQLNACGLEEIFLSSGSDFNVTEDDLNYAEDACAKILEAVRIIRG